MSHFSTIQSQIKDRDILVQALTNLGLTAKVNEPAACFKGWYGPSDAKADVVISGKTVNTVADIAFEQANDSYKIWADKFDWTTSNLPGKKDFLYNLHQEYATEVVRRKAEAQGLRIVEETQQNGTRRLTLTTSNLR